VAGNPVVARQTPASPLVDQRVVQPRNAIFRAVARMMGVNLTGSRSTVLASELSAPAMKAYVALARSGTEVAANIKRNDRPMIKFAISCGCVAIAAGRVNHGISPTATSAKMVTGIATSTAKVVTGIVTSTAKT
jgi:hypothetical protein